MTRYRWRSGPRKGQWHATIPEARQAAAKAGEAERDEHEDRVNLFPLTWIEDEDGRKV